MSHIKPLSETPDSVTLSRTDFDTMLEELEDAEDRLAVLEDCLLDLKPEQDRLLLSMADTTRIIDGVSPVTVWRERRGMTRAELALAAGLDEASLVAIEAGGAVEASSLDGIANILNVPPAMLSLGEVAA